MELTEGEKEAEALPLRVPEPEPVSAGEGEWEKEVEGEELAQRERAGEGEGLGLRLRLPVVVAQAVKEALPPVGLPVGEVAGCTVRLGCWEGLGEAEGEAERLKRLALGEAVSEAQGLGLAEREEVWHWLADCVGVGAGVAEREARVAEGLKLAQPLALGVRESEAVALALALEQLEAEGVRVPLWEREVVRLEEEQ